MCGVAGVLYRGSGAEIGPVGQDLLTMSACLQHRGADSAGFAVFGAATMAVRLQVLLPAGAALPEPQAVLAASRGKLAQLAPMGDNTSFTAILSGENSGALELAELARRIEAAIPGASVTSAGKRMSVYKTMGLASRLTNTVESLKGTHGIAHLRLATESRIDPAHAQPFWGRGYPDIAVTHNGHITNYHKMRKRFEADGYSFGSANDSEIIGIYLGNKMESGLSFSEALEASVTDLDGSFSYIAATKHGLGVARDSFATKPLLYTENGGVVALASEPQALHRLLGDAIVMREIQPKETRTWEIA